MKTIVWDLDDVLNGFTENWLKRAWQVEHPECHRVYTDLRSNPALAELNASEAEYLASQSRFRLSPAAQDLPPNPALAHWFERTGARFRHAVLAAPPVTAVAPAAQWVFAHFGRWIRDFHALPSPLNGEALPAYDASKAELLARLGGVDFFVDDSPQQVAAAEARGIRALLFPQPWNHAETPLNEMLAELSRNNPK